jgi:hypothetical protein
LATGRRKCEIAAGQRCRLAERSGRPAELRGECQADTAEEHGATAAACKSDQAARRGLDSDGRLQNEELIIVQHNRAQQRPVVVPRRRQCSRPAGCKRLRLVRIGCIGHASVQGRCNRHRTCATGDADALKGK